MPNAPWYNDINVWEVATECRSCVNVTCEGGIKKNLDKEQTYPHMTMKLNWENKSMSNYFGSCRRKTPMKEHLSICVQYKCEEHVYIIFGIWIKPYDTDKRSTSKS